MRDVLAIDIGGTKLAVGVVTADGEIVAQGRRSTPRDADADTLFAALLGLIEELPADARSGCASIGVGCGGPMRDRGALVSPLNIPAWRDFPLAARLVDGLGLGFVVVDNDAKAFTLAEGWKGAAVGHANYIGMVVSTGVGGGIVLNGEMLEGGDGNAGHIGHLVVVPDGREHAGVKGCLEGEASGTAIAAHLGVPAAEAPLEWRQRTGRLVGRAVGGVANLLDLDLAVVAGSVALGYGADFFDAAQAEIDAVARLDYSSGTRIVPASLGADSHLIGAAGLALKAQGHRVLSTTR